MDEYLEFAKDIAYHAGEIMLHYFYHNPSSRYKKDQTIVTLADQEINAYLIQRVKEKYPTHAIDGEEEQFGASRYVWVLDPVDGTSMYARGVPVAVCSLALVVDGVTQLGVIYDPFTDHLYSAVLGKGAYRNEERISVNSYLLSDIKSVAHCDMWSKEKYKIYRVVEELSKITSFSDIGSIARAGCLVATGDYSFAIFTGTKHKNCDIAALKVIVEEAGGVVTDLFGEDQRYDQSVRGALISNGIVHDEVLRVIQKYLVEV